MLKRLWRRQAGTAERLIPAAVSQVGATAATDCTEFGQGPVDELHLIENRRDKVLYSELTLFLSSVESISFFDRFRTVFSVGGESGAQAQLTAVRAAKKAGIAGQRLWFRQAHATPVGIESRARIRRPRRWQPCMGAEADVAIQQADAAMRLP
jgi:hypothetical protein